MFKKSNLLCLLTTCISSSIYSKSMTLEDALVQGYKYNKEIKMLQEGFLEEVQSIPIAIASNFLPDVSLIINQTDARQKQNNMQRSFESSSFDNNLRIRQNILKGGIDVASIRLADESFKSFKNVFLNTEQEIILGMIQSYLDTWETRQRLEISKSSLEYYKLTLKSVLEKFKLGEATKTEVAYARSSLSDAETNVVAVEAKLQALKANFLSIFGIDVEDELVIPNVSDLEDISKIKEKAAKNFEVTSIKHRQKAQSENLKIAYGKLLPRVDMSVDFLKNKSTQRSDITNKTITSTISMTVPIIPNGGADYLNIRKVKASGRKAAFNLEKVLNDSVAKATGLYSQYKSYISIVDSSEDFVNYLSIALDATKQEEALGSKTITDVLESEKKLYDGKIKLVSSKKEMILYFYKTKASIGELTIKDLKLPIATFDPEKEYKNAKNKILGL